MKTARITIRINPNQKLELTNKQKNLGYRSLSKYILDSVLNSKSKQPSNLKIYFELNRIANKLAYLEVNSTPTAGIDRQVLKHIYEIRSALDKLIKGALK